MFKGFRKFLLHGNVVVTAMGLVIALAFSQLVAAFTTDIVQPLVTRAQGDHKVALGVQLGAPGNPGTLLNFGALVSAVIYFFIFMTVVYLTIVTPYRVISARRGRTVFGDPPPTKSCPYCLSDDLPLAAVKCRHCASALDVAPEQAAT